jgi:hypothetical protein
MHKGKIFSTNFVENCFLWSRYGTGTVTWQKLEPEPELFKSRNRNRKK